MVSEICFFQGDPLSKKMLFCLLYCETCHTRKIKKYLIGANVFIFQANSVCKWASIISITYCQTEFTECIQLLFNHKSKVKTGKLPWGNRCERPQGAFTGCKYLQRRWRRSTFHLLMCNLRCTGQNSCYDSQRLMPLNAQLKQRTTHTHSIKVR